MKALFLTYGSRGDVQPYCALALALKQRGHGVRVAAPENYKSLVQGLGLDYAALPGDTIKVLDDPGVRDAMMRNRTLEFFKRASDLLGAEHFSGLAALALEAAEGCDAVVTGTVPELLAQSVCEKLGKRLVLTELVPLSSSWERQHFTLPFNLGLLNPLTHFLGHWGWWKLHQKDINRLRLGWGLSKLDFNPLNAHRNGSGLVLHGYSQALCGRPKSWGANHVVSGAWSLASVPPADEGFSKWVETGVAPFYLSFGSLPILPAQELAELAAEVSESLNLRAVVMAAGIEKAYGEDCAIPDGLALVEAVDHGWLFPQMSAIVHHAGAGTTHAASLSGVPQVACPVFADQFYWARRLKRLGVAQVLPARGLDSGGLARALEKAAGEETQAKAASLAQAMSEEGGAPAAALALERAFSKGA